MTVAGRTEKDQAVAKQTALSPAPFKPILHLSQGRVPSWPFIRSQTEMGNDVKV